MKIKLVEKAENGRQGKVWNSSIESKTKTFPIQNRRPWVRKWTNPFVEHEQSIGDNDDMDGSFEQLMKEKKKYTVETTLMNVWLVWSVWSKSTYEMIQKQEW